MRRNRGSGADLKTGCASQEGELTHPRIHQCWSLTMENDPSVWRWGVCRRVMLAGTGSVQEMWGLLFTSLSLKDLQVRSHVSEILFIPAEHQAVMLFHSHQFISPFEQQQQLWLQFLPLRKPASVKPLQVWIQTEPYNSSHHEISWLCLFCPSRFYNCVQKYRDNNSRAVSSDVLLCVRVQKQLYFHTSI